MSGSLIYNTCVFGKNTYNCCGTFKKYNFAFEETYERLLVLSPHFLKNDGDIAIASVRPSRYLLLIHWMKTNQIWCVSWSHDN